MAHGGYTEWRPPADLSAAVACLWRGRIGDPAVPYTDRVLPDGCTDLIWDGARLFVAGPDTGPVLIDHVPARTLIGIRVAPGYAGALLGCPASEVRDERVALSDLWEAGLTTVLREAIQSAPNDLLAARLLTSAVRRQLARMPPHDPIVGALIASLRSRSHNPATGRIAALAADLGVTERSLHRRCCHAIGYGPKVLDRILRLRRALRMARRRPALSLAELAAAAGYSDQAHFTRECCRLSGLSPARLLRLSAPIVSDGSSETFNTPVQGRCSLHA